MVEKEPYILWLPSWYPDKLQPYNGDFIQRHAKAASIYRNIEVIYVIKDEEGIVTRDIAKEVKVSGQLRETIIHYYHPKSGFPLYNKWKSYQKYLSIYKIAVKEVFSIKGYPDLVNVYIALRAGVIGRWIKKKYRINYVISEQWTIYLKEARPNFYSLPFYLRRICKYVFKHASATMVVSNYLGESLQLLFKVPKPILIPNVVDGSIFNVDNLNSKTGNRFIHISTLEYQKNPESIIEAFRIIKEKGIACTLDIVGPDVPFLTSLVKLYGLENYIKFYSEMPQPQLVSYIQQSDALILYSRYETFGCVLIEAFACGVPVIVSDIPVIHENVDGTNGLYAENDNPVALANQIISFITKRHSFEAHDISVNAIKKYSYDAIGLLFCQWYQSVSSIRSEVKV